MKEFYLSALFVFSTLLTFAQNPVITTQPYLNGGFVCYGSNAEIKANASNAISYQLQTKNTVAGTYSDFGGYTGNAAGPITINLANVTQELTLRVTFTNASGTTNSDDFQVFAQKPIFTIQPQNQVQCLGEDIYFYVDEVAGNTYEWERSNNGGAFSSSGFAAKIKNENTSALWIDGANSAEHNDSFRCKVTDSNGCENTSEAGTIFINSTGTIQPTSSTEFCEDGFANFFLKESDVDGTVDSFQWSANDGTNTFSGSAFEEVSALSFNVSKVPGNLSGVEVALQFTNSLMQPNGSLAAGTCAYSRDRSSYYTTNPKPASPTTIAADSVCGTGMVNLEVTDSRTDWNWSATPEGTVLGTGKTFQTPSLTSSAYYYVSFTDANNCKSGPDSVLAIVNPLPNLTLGSIAPVCPGTSSFEIPFNNLSAGADKYSLTLASGSMPDFVSIVDAAITATALTIVLPSNAANGNYTFNLVLENSATECLSEIIPVNLYIQKATGITTEPLAAEICEGDSHTFSVVAEGEGTLSYQWFFNSNLISGAESATYQIDKATLSNGGSYYCKVTATCGLVNSSAVVLTVKPKTKITTQPINDSVCEGSDVSFSVAASGSGTLTYQWKKDGNNIGTNSSTLNLEGVSASDNGAKITCLVQGDCGDSLSAEATLTVYALPLAPAAVDTGYCLNSSAAALTATAVTGNHLNWYGNSPTGGTASSMAPTPSTNTAGTVNYYVSQTDANSCESERTLIKVNITNAVTANLSSSASAVCAHGEINKTVFFTIAGQNGDGSYTYQWGKDNVDINGEISETYTGSGAGDYYVKVVSGYCGVTKTSTITAVLPGASQGPTVSGSGLTLPYTVCPGGSATFNAATNTAGTDYKWYASPTGNASLNSSAIYNISNVLSAKTYYAAVQQTDGLTTCETERTAVSIFVYDTPAIVETITPESCPGEGDGSVSLAAQTSNLPYQFKLDAGSFKTVNVFNDLTAKTYQITLQDNKGCSATTSLTMTSGAAPVFNTQPLSQTNCDGNTVTFETATDAVYTMSWEKKLPDGNWALITGESDVDLRLTNVGNATNPHGTSYRVTAASSTCSTVSDEVVLSVNDFTENLANQDVCAGDMITWVPPATVGTIQNYEWQRKVSGGSFVAVQSGASPNYVINAVTAAEDADQYRVKITFEKTGGTCLETSDGGTLNVTEVTETTLSGTAEICSGETTTLTATGCNGTLTWSDSQEGAIASVSPTETTVYTASCTLDNCTVPASNSVTVTVKPGITAPTIMANKTEVCYGDSATLSISGCAGVILWSSGESTSKIIAKTLGAVNYSATCTDSGCTSPVSNSIEITAYPELMPGSISASTDVNCAGFNPSTISNETSPSGGKGTLTISWESSENCSDVSPVWAIVPSASGETFNPTALSKTTCYRRKVVDECGTELYSNISTIQIVDDPSVVVSSSESSICSNQSFMLTASVSGGTGVCNTIWQRNLKSSASGSSFWEDIPGTALTNTISDLENTEASTISVYFRAIYDCDLTNCNKATSDAIEIQVLPSSEVVLNMTDTTVCIGNSVVLTASSCGGVLTWSDGGDGLSRTIEVVASASYTATCTSACGTFTATANLNAIPGYKPPVNTTPISAIQPDVLTFSAAGTNLKWYASSTVDTSLNAAPTEKEIGTYTYFVSQSNSTCESPRIEINASVYSPLTIVNQPTDQFDCEGNSVYFSVEAIGAGDIYYQWQRKRPGETVFTDLKDDDEGIRFPLTANLRVSAVGDNDNPVLSEYRCRMSDSLSYIQTYERVLYANVIDGTLPNMDACVGTDFEFRLYDFVRTTGDIMSFQWQIRDDVVDEWIDISDDFRTSGSQTANMTIKNIQMYDNRKYRCSLVFNTGGFQCTENTDQTILKISDFPNRPPDLTAEYCQGKTTKTLSFNAKPNDDLWYTHENEEAIGFKKAPKPSSDEAGVFTWWFTEITDENCESPKAKYTVTIHAKPEAPASTTPFFANEGDTLSFNANGENLHWFTSRTGKSFTTEKPFYTEIDEYKHYVSQTSEFGCESDRTLIISFIQGTLGFKKELEDKADCEGNSVRFYANGKGIGSIDYLWEKKVPGDTLFREIVGELGSSLLVSKIGSEENPHLTQFRVKVSDTTGLEISNAAYLLVNEIKGSLNTQYYCADDNWRVNLMDLEVQGKVNEYQLQVQPERSWVTLDTILSLDSTRVLSFYDLKDTAFMDSDYRIRLVFEAENGGTCSRSTDEFNFRLEERPSKPEKLAVELCQNLKLDLPAMDTLYYTWFENMVDTSLVWNLPSDTAGSFMYYYAYQDTVSGCVSEKDTFLLEILPVDSVFLMSNEFVFCTEDTTAVLNIEGIDNYTWFRDDSLKTKIGDTLAIAQNAANQETYFFETVFENGCTSPLKEILVKVESCEADSPLDEDDGDNLVVNTAEGEAVCLTYPNPFKPNEPIDLYTENLIFDKVEIVNSQGQIVPNRLFERTEFTQKLQLNSDLSDGVYILRILGEKGNHCEWKMVMAK